jgi:hypothetical protein
MRSRLERPSEVCPALGLAERFDNPECGGWRDGQRDPQWAVAELEAHDDRLGPPEAFASLLQVRHQVARPVL